MRTAPTSLSCTSRLCLAAALLLGTAACGESPTKPVEVPAPVASVELSESSLTLTPGQTHRLTAIARAANGTILTGRTITWRTSDATVTAVGTDGHVTASGLGTARVIAEVEGRIAEAAVAVIPGQAADLAGWWRLVSFDGQTLPAAYAVFLDEPVGDRIIGRVEIRLDSAVKIMRADGLYQRQYCFTELHDDVTVLRYCWGDHGRFTVSVVERRSRLTLVSEYIQNLDADGEARADGTLSLTEPLWVGESPRQTVWSRR